MFILAVSPLEKDQFINAHKHFVHDISVESYAAMETDEDVKMNTQVDKINAYSFLYPVELPGKKFSFKWYFSSLYYNSVPPSTLSVRISLLFILVGFSMSTTRITHSDLLSHSIIFTG